MLLLVTVSKEAMAVERAVNASAERIHHQIISIIKCTYNIKSS